MIDETIDSTMASMCHASTQRSGGKVWRNVVASLMPPRVLLFLLVFVWYLCCVVDMRLVFQARDRLFLLNLGFMGDFLVRPGGLLVWMDRLLVQLAHYGWPAAAVLATMLWVLIISTIAFMSSTARARVHGTWILPAILLLWLLGGYRFNTTTLTALSLAMLAVNIWVRVPLHRTWSRLLMFGGMSCTLYCGVGTGYYVFAACCLIHEAVSRRRLLLAATFVLAAVALVVGLDAVLAHFAQPFLYRHMPLPNESEGAIREVAGIIVYAYFPACALLLCRAQPIEAWMNRLWRRCRATTASTDADPGFGGKKVSDGDRSILPMHTNGFGSVSGRLRRRAATLMLLGAALAMGCLSVDRDARASLQIDYFAENEQWGEVLQKAKKLPRRLYTPRVNHDVNMALYHTGSLLTDMFSFPQIELPSFEAGPGEMGESARQPCDLLLEMGRVNEAEGCAYEMFELTPSGGAMKRLAFCKMIKGQAAAAYVLLNVLKDDLVWGHWAKEYLRRLLVDPQLTMDEGIRRVRSLMVQEEDVHLICQADPSGKILHGVQPIMAGLLKQNGKNRMAFEYLMAVNLARRSIGNILADLEYLKELPYSDIPLLCEQALMVGAMRREVDITRTSLGYFFRGRKISEATVRTTLRFQELVAPYGGPTIAARERVEKELGDTYFYYCWYGARWAK